MCTYRAERPDLTTTITVTENWDILIYPTRSTSVKFSSVGDYSITVTLGSNPNYTVSGTDGNLHINPKAASVSADNKSKTNGDDNTALTATVTRTVNGDTMNYTLATKAVKYKSECDY